MTQTIEPHFSFVEGTQPKENQSFPFNNQKEKIKRRGVADSSRAQKSKMTPYAAASSSHISKPSSSRNVSFINQEREQTRLDSLQHIKTLKRENSIKVSTINKEINRLIKFIGSDQSFIDNNGHIHTLVINGHRIPYTFESPHAPSNAYEGHKLKRVLTLLEIGYIANANPDEIENLIIPHDLDRLDKVFTFLFLNRGQLK